METQLSRDLRNAGEKAQYNAHCQRILGNQQVLVRILKGVVEEFKDSTLEEIEACLVGKQKFRPGYPLIKRGIFYGCRMIDILPVWNRIHRKEVWRAKKGIQYPGMYECAIVHG